MAMTVIGQWAVWLVLVFALAALMNKKPVETAAPAAFFVILLLYLGGLLGNLLIGMGLMIPCYLFTVGNVCLSPWPLYERNRVALVLLTAGIYAVYRKCGGKDLGVL